MKSCFWLTEASPPLHLLKQLRRLHWHYRMRVKSSFYVYLGNQGRPLCDYRLRSGTALFLNYIYLTRERYGFVHLALGHHPQTRDRWLVVTDQPTSVATLVESAWRFDIAEGFLDHKSNCFQLESSQIQDAKMLSRLCLVLAISTLYLSPVGTEVVESGCRRFVDPHSFLGTSYLQIRWRWIRQSLVQAWELPSWLSLSDIADSEPAMASRIQAQKRIRKFQFHPLKAAVTSINCSNFQKAP